MLKIKKLHEDAVIPTKGTEDSTGYDLYAIEDVLLTKETTKIRTGLQLIIPKGYYGRLAPRSSLGSKGIVLNGGVVDCDYRGEVLLLLQTTNTDSFQINKGDRIAQLIVERYYDFVITEITDENDEKETTRIGGFGSTGK